MVSLLDDHPEEMEVHDDQLSYKQPRTKIRSRHIDINQSSKQLPEKEESPEINTAQMLKI